MSDIGIFFSIALGVLVAILYPIVWALFRKAFPPPTAAPRLPSWIPKYALLLVFSLFTAFVILVAFRSANPDAKVSFYQAVVFGFGWEATIEKIFVPPQKPVPTQKPAGS